MEFHTFFPVLGVLLLSGFFSGMEIAYLSSDRLRVELDRNKGGLTGRILTLLFKNPENYITTMLVGNNIVLVMYGLLMTVILDPILEKYISIDWLLLLINSLISTMVIIIFGEYLPKSYFKKNSNSVMRFFALPVVFFYIILFPLSIFCTYLSMGVLKILGSKKDDLSQKRLTSVELDHYLSENLTKDGGSGELDTEVKILQKAIDFKNIRARDCMIPRNEIIACEQKTDIEDLKQLFISTGLSKVIVYEDSIDDVIGYIHSSEIFKGSNWQARMKTALYVPESTNGDKLMKLLMQKKCSIAIVIDEMGGTSGIITLEDLVEEIFGEIEDEHDLRKLEKRQINENTYVISARSEIDELNELFGLELPESDEYNTLAGLILYHNCSIPQVDEIVEVGNFSFKILKSTSTRIELIELTKNQL